jgi:hypothetical protein
MNTKKISIFILAIAVSFLGFTKVSFASTNTLYFNNATSTSWDDLENWWTDASNTIPASSIPVNGDTVYLGATTTQPSVGVTLVNIYVASSTTGGGSFSVNFTGATSTATFYDGSYNQGTINGTSTFYDSSINFGDVEGSAFFHNSSGNSYGSAYVHGTSTFYDSSFNTYYLVGNAFFYNSSYNNGQLIGDAVFNNSSANSGALYGNATFYDTTSNNYGVNGDAFFSCSATNNSTVSGTTTYGVTCPTIVSGTLASDNSYIDVTVSEPVWGDNSSTTVLAANKLKVIFVQNGGSATAATISSITKTSGGALDGSETVIRVNLSITGTPNGLETIAIKALNGTSVYNAAGDPMRPEQTTGNKTLNDQTSTPVVHHGGRRSIIEDNSTTTEPESTSTEITSTSTASTSSILTISTSTLKIIFKTNGTTTILPYQFTFTQILKLGSIGDEVKQLQIFLNTHGFPLSQIGNGSLGHETNYFGQKTKDALIKFQEANLKDILTPQNITKGTGIFWIYSKKFANQILNQ